MNAVKRGIPVVALVAMVWATPVIADTGGADAYQKCQDAFAQQDIGSAVSWCEASADQGSADGENGLGTMYLNGQGVTRDLAKAAKLFAAAAAQGNAKAENNLAAMYFDGQGVAEDRPRAVALFQKSAAQGNAEADNNLKAIYGQFPELRPKQP